MTGVAIHHSRLLCLLWTIGALLLVADVATAGDCLQGPWRARFVFVGINHYEVADRNAQRLNTSDMGPSGRIEELAGPENDVAIIRQAIADAYDLPLAGSQVKAPGINPAPCERPGGLSVTLLGECATRDAILSAFREAIQCAAPGYTVLFYFAGHGAELGDRTGLEPDADGMILPVNARVNPNDPDDADIAGWEITNIVNSGTQRGVNVVTIFDSCHSAAASRALVTATARGAPPMPVVQKTPPRQPLINAGAGHHIHLAATDHDGQAWETQIKEFEDQSHGLFTAALALAIRQLKPSPGVPAPTYEDIFDAASAQFAPILEQHQQRFYREGPVYDRFLGGAAPARIAKAIFDPKTGGFTLDAGADSGVTKGSTYGLFPNSTDAALAERGDKAGLIAEVLETLPYSARLIVSSGKAPAENLFAREITHRFASAPLRVRVDVPGPLGNSISQTLSGTGMIAVGPRDPQYFVRATADGVIVTSGRRRAAPGRDDGKPGYDTSDTSAFLEQLSADITKIAHYHEILALAGQSKGSRPAIAVVPHDPKPEGCLDLSDAPLTEVAVGQPFDIVLSNPTEGRYLAWIQLSNDFSVKAKWPPANATQEILVHPGCPLRFSGATVNEPAHMVYVLLSTDKPIYASDFDQAGARGSEPPPDDPLRAILWRAMAGTRGVEAGSPPPVDWAAAVFEFDVKSELGRP